MKTRCPIQLVVAFVLVLAAAGCTGYALQDVRGSFAAGEYDRAMEQLDEHQALSLPYLFERGLVAHYADAFPDSNRAFELAEQVSEDLYTKSLSRELTALLTSDQARQYAGTRYERLLIHYYRALNYVYMGLPDDALVEVRRAGRLLQHYADQDPKYQFAGAAFVAYFSGIMYEWAHEWNDAYIAYRWAEAGYARYREAFGVEPPPDLGGILVRLSRRLGFEDESARYSEQYGEPPCLSDDWGEFILIYESGYAPRKVEENLVLPILTADGFAEADEVWVFADTVVTRRHVRYKKTELEYLLRVAIPTVVSERPVLTGIEAQVEDLRGRAALVEDLGEVTLATFESEQGTILLRTVARGLLKYLAYRGAKEKGALAGFLVNALNIATESADTRSWQTLPHLISVLRLPLPPGTHSVQLSLLDDQGSPVGSETLEDVPIEPGDMTFWNYRTFD